MSMNPTVAEDLAYVAWAEQNMDGYADYVERENQRAYAAWVDGLCEGHESLAGGHMGETVYCDGTCVPESERDWDAFIEATLADEPRD